MTGHTRDSLGINAGDPTLPRLLEGLPEPPAWMDDALCAQVDNDSFFPEKGGSTKAAKQVCVSCTVAAECLDFALGNGERFGIWGGLSERELRAVAKHINQQQESA